MLKYFIWMIGMVPASLLDIATFLKFDISGRWTSYVYGNWGGLV